MKNSVASLIREVQLKNKMRHRDVLSGVPAIGSAVSTQVRSDMEQLEIAYVIAQGSVGTTSSENCKIFFFNAHPRMFFSLEGGAWVLERHQLIASRMRLTRAGASGSCPIKLCQ